MRLKLYILINLLLLCFVKVNCQTSENRYYYSKRYSNNEGTYNVDNNAHEFSNGLKQNGIDSLLICSFNNDNFVKPSEEVYVFWNYKGIGYIKTFKYTSKKEIIESRPQICDLNALISKYQELRLDTIISYPKTSFKISHETIISIELYFPGVRFKDSMEKYLITAGKEHPKAIWGRMVLETIRVNCP
jgi:hypothetical protein